MVVCSLVEAEVAPSFHFCGIFTFVVLKISNVSELHAVDSRAAAVYRRRGDDWSVLAVTAYHELSGMTNECCACKALRFVGEPAGICCLSGKVVLPHTQDAPEPLTRAVTFFFLLLICGNMTVRIQHVADGAECCWAQVPGEHPLLQQCVELGIKQINFVYKNVVSLCCFCCFLFKLFWSHQARRTSRWPRRVCTLSESTPTCTTRLGPELCCRLMSNHKLSFSLSFTKIQISGTLPSFY